MTKNLLKRRIAPNVSRSTGVIHHRRLPANAIKPNVKRSSAGSDDNGEGRGEGEGKSLVVSEREGGQKKKKKNEGVEEVEAKWKER